MRLSSRTTAEAGGSSTFFAVKLFGQDSEVLGRLAEETERRLETVAGRGGHHLAERQGRRGDPGPVDRDKAAGWG